MSKEYPKTVKIELDLPIEVAFYLGTFIHSAIQGKPIFDITEKAKKQMIIVGQNIVDQVAFKMKEGK